MPILYRLVIIVTINLALLLFAFIESTKRGVFTGVNTSGNNNDVLLAVGGDGRSVVDRSKPQPEGSAGVYYVFLQKFPLLHTGGLVFHTEVLVCPRRDFTTPDQEMLDRVVASLLHDNFMEMDETWWSSTTTTSTVNCVELGYGGSTCTTACCSVPHGQEQLSYPFHSRRAVIGNADGTKKSLYLYGTGDLDGEDAYRATCRGDKCWSRWSGTDYNPFTNNCNTFTSTILSCVYGLSEKKPNLGPSDMITVKCHCRPSSFELIAAES